MLYKVSMWENFCRVFELPAEFSAEFCFNGGIATAFKMVDWFNPIYDLGGVPALSKKCYAEKVGPLGYAQIDSEKLQKRLTDDLMRKNYVKSYRTYVVLCDFGFSFMFTGISCVSIQKKEVIPPPKKNK